MNAGTIVLATVLVATVLAGCGEPSGGVAPPRDSQGRYIVGMTSNLTFDPAEVRIPVGATLVWRNNATMPHDVAAYRGDPIESDYSEFSSTDPPPVGLGRLIEPGNEYAYMFAQKGTWTIWCHTHHEERMKGVVHVV